MKKKEKRKIMSEEDLRYVADRNGWGFYLKDGEEVFEDGMLIITLYDGVEKGRLSLRKAITTETEEAVDYQLREMVRKFQEAILERQLDDRDELYKIYKTKEDEK